MDIEKSLENIKNFHLSFELRLILCKYDNTKPYWNHLLHKSNKVMFKKYCQTDWDLFQTESDEENQIKKQKKKIAKNIQKTNTSIQDFFHFDYIFFTILILHILQLFLY